VTRTRAATLALIVLATASACAASSAPATAATASPLPGVLTVEGRVLVVSAGYLVFTTGDAVRLGEVRLPRGLALGSTVRVRIDTARRLVTSVEPATGPAVPGEVDAAALPRTLVAGDPRSIRAPAPSGAGAQSANAAQGGGLVTVTIDVSVPDVTPPGDDIYLSTDRTAFAPAELRMNRVDAFTWTVALPVASGSTLRYEFTRGSPSTVERTRGGGIFTPRELTAAAGLHENDAVARWSDRF
jgi:hypothetical protein